MFADPGAVARDLDAKGMAINLTNSIVRTMFPSTVDATIVKTRTDASGVVKTLGGVGALYEVSYEVKDAAGCMAGLPKLNKLRAIMTTIKGPPAPLTAQNTRLNNLLS